MKASTRTGTALGLAAVACVLVLSGCGASGMSGPGTTPAPTVTEQLPSDPATTTEPAPATAARGSIPGAAQAGIRIRAYKYVEEATVSPGTQITVTNEDIEVHSITADTGNAFDTVTQAGNSNFTAPTEPGIYPYHCIFHANMKGTLTVK